MKKHDLKKKADEYEKQAIAHYIYELRQEWEVDFGDDASDYSHAEDFLREWKKQYLLGGWPFIRTFFSWKFFGEDINGKT